MKLPSLDDFLKDPPKGWDKNAYVRYPGFSSLYVRYTQRYIEGVYRFPVLDLASLEVSDRGKGTFTKLLTHLRTVYPHLWLYVECVNNPRFAKKLPSLGFTRSDDGLSPCFYMAPEKPV